MKCREHGGSVPSHPAAATPTAPQQSQSAQTLFIFVYQLSSGLGLAGFGLETANHFQGRVKGKSRQIWKY